MLQPGAATYNAVTHQQGAAASTLTLSARHSMFCRGNYTCRSSMPYRFCSKFQAGRWHSKRNCGVSSPLQQAPLSVHATCSAEATHADRARLTLVQHTASSHRKKQQPLPSSPLQPVDLLARQRTQCTSQHVLQKQPHPSSMPYSLQQANKQEGGTARKKPRCLLTAAAR
jgi:hypothetical protein